MNLNKNLTKTISFVSVKFLLVSVKTYGKNIQLRRIMKERQLTYIPLGP